MSENRFIDHVTDWGEGGYVENFYILNVSKRDFCDVFPCLVTIFRKVIAEIKTVHLLWLTLYIDIVNSTGSN